MVISDDDAVRAMSAHAAVRPWPDGGYGLQGRATGPELPLFLATPDGALYRTHKP